MPHNKRWPPGEKFDKSKVTECDSEGGLLAAFITKLDLIDPDVIVGHDLYSRIMGLITNRIKPLKL